jgi:hypothetical protein
MRTLSALAACALAPLVLVACSSGTPVSGPTPATPSAEPPGVSVVADLGSDPATWENFDSLADEYDGTFEELIETITAV